jgi:hypothetical protein
MKKILLLFLVIVPGLLSAQDSTAHFTTSELGQWEMDYFIGRDSNHFYGIRKQTDYFTILRFDKEFHEETRKEFHGLTLKDGYYDVYDCRFIDGKPVMFYFKREKKIRTLALAEVDPVTLELKGTYETLASYLGLPDVLVGSTYPDMFTDYNFQIDVSSHGHFFSISYIFERKTHFLLFDASFRKVWEVNYDMYFVTYYRDLQVTDDGRIYLVHKNVNALPKNWMFVEMKDGKLTGTPINCEEFEFFRGKIGFTQSGRAFVAGYYSFYQGEYTTIRNVGIFFFAPWRDNGNVHFTPFTKELLCRNASPQRKKEVNRQFEKYDCAGAEAVYNLQLITDSAGNIFLVGEELFDQSLGLAPAISVVGQNSVLTIQGQPNERLRYEDILISLIDTLGNVGPNTWIRKRQKDVGNASFSARAGKGQITFYFNDNHNNVLHPRDSTTVPAMYSDIERSVIVAVTVDVNGHSTRDLPFGESNVELEPQRSFTILNKLIIVGTQKKSLCFAEL